MVKWATKGLNDHIKRQRIGVQNNYDINLTVHDSGLREGGWDVIRRETKGLTAGPLAKIPSSLNLVDDHSDVLIGAGGERSSDWPAHVFANDVRTRIDQ